MSRLSYCNYCGTRLIQSRRLVGLFGRGLDRSSEPLPRSPLLAWADEEGGMSGSSLEDECEEVDPLDQPQSLSGRFHPLAPTIPKCTPFGWDLLNRPHGCSVRKLEVLFRAKHGAPMEG